MNESLQIVIRCIGSSFPLIVLCLSLSTIMSSKSISKKSLGSYIIVSVIMFLLLLRS